jgi:peptidoglycan/LPS O-acetylase OafA/YrhL
MWVFLLHASVAGGVVNGGGLWPIVQFGWLGVDLFFALSGFLLTQQALNKRGGSFTNPFARALGEPVRDFLLRRVLRVYPAYYACVAVLLVLAAAGIYRSVPTVTDMTLHLGMLHNFDYVFIDSMNGVFWSLPFEWQFYLAFPAILYAGLRYGWILLLAVAVASAVVTRMWVTWTDDGFLLMHLLARIDTFVVGMAAAVLALRTPNAPVVRRLLWIVGLGMMISLPWVFTSLPGGARHDGWLGTLRLLWIDGALALLLLGLAGRDRWAATVLGNPVMVWIGTVSYGIYLVHVPVLELLPLVGAYPPRGVGLDAGFVRVLVMATPIVLILAALSHYLIEAPFQAAGRRGGYSSVLRVRRPLVLLASCAVLLFMVTVALQ